MRISVKFQPLFWLSVSFLLSQSNLTVIKASRLIDGKGGKKLIPAMALINEKAIIEVGKKIKIPKDANIINLLR